ncbi:MAG TPA: putative baseplate assembly protein [Verrucomicrobiae bacterium]|nr:putative baseplate assembly protein [Verrucomicrobiae bacterium]
MIYLCCDKRRRLLLREENDHRKANGQTPLNGIDFLEVLDQDAPEGVGGIKRQNTLLVRLFEPAPAFTAGNVRIEGGERITPVRVIWAFAANAIPAAVAPPGEQNFFAALPSPDPVLVVRTDSTGDYSRYRLSLTKSPNDPAPPDDFDPLFTVVEFSFKVECPSDFDCAPQKVCPPAVETAPTIDYLAKDYASFRRLMLDRMSLLMPQWRERNAADLGVTLVELLAYAGDRLSYQQDATATEAYLDTARRRVSVRRHARLVDYFMHDGCNARTWVQVRCARATAGVVLAEKTPLLSKVIPGARRLAPNSLQFEEAMRLRPAVFETMKPLKLFGEHDAMPFYAWGDERCCLPKGATRATLQGHFPYLERGHVLIFAEVKNPKSGKPANPETRIAEDADRARRHAVRLKRVRPFAGGGGPLTDPLNGQEITEIAWDAADALPFPFCISSLADSDDGEQPVSGVSEAWGNIVLADHGRTVLEEKDEKLHTVPKSTLVRYLEDGDRCQPVEPVPVPPRFRLKLQRAPVTQASPYDPGSPAAQAMATSPAEALPVIGFKIPGETEPWEPLRDLLNSGADDNEFVVEVETDGATSIRFGDGVHGRRPKSGQTCVEIQYRVGNGNAGNIGADTLYHVVTNEPAVVSVSNPLPAQGGVEPETMDEVRHRAPYAFRTQDRAVTEADYAAKAELNPAAQRAAATFRWTGSWHTVFVTVDPLGGVLANQDLKQQFEEDALEGLERYRMAGHDLEADEPRYVSLEIEMHICVKSDYFRSEVHAALLEVFSSRTRPDGRLGVFHPDNFTFGQAVHLSPLYAAAQAVPGVASVHITTFQRQDLPSNEALQEGKLKIDRLEIARCDNDPSFPEHGVLRIHLGGGK